MEELINSYKLIVNNNPDYSTRPSSQDTIFIIDLTLSTSKLGLYMQNR